MGRRQKGTARPADVRPADVRPVDAQSTVMRSVDVRPVDVDGVRTVAIVTVGWGVAFVILALRQGVLNDAGRGWWLWTCLAGVGLGLLGLEYCRKRRDAIAQAALDAEAGSDDADDPSLVGDWSRMPDEADDDAFGGEQPQADQQVAAGTHLTQPYQPADAQTNYTTGDMPPVPTMPRTSEQPSSPRHRAPVAQHPTELAQPGHLPPSPAPPAAPPLPPAVQRQAPMPPASGRPSQQPQRPAVQQPVPQRPAAQSPTPTSGPPGLPAGQQPPRKAERPPGPSRAPSVPPAQQPEAPPPDPYSTGAGWYDAPAGYSPDPDRARRHPRDRGNESQGPARPEPGLDRPRRSSLEDSEFFGAESSAPPPNSTAEFLLADLAEDDDKQQQEPEPPSRHDRDATDDDYRGRRARRPR